MTVLINTDEILYNVRKIAHNELRIAIQDDAARYAIEPGEEKTDELKQLIAEAFEELHEMIARFLAPTPTDTSFEIDNSDNQLPEKFELEFITSERRTASRLATIGQKCFSFLSQRTLSNYYGRVAQIDLSNAHDRVSAMDAQMIEKVLFSKLPPRI